MANQFITVMMEDECCLCGNPKDSSDSTLNHNKSVICSEDHLDALSGNLCKLLNLPYYPYGEDLLTLHSCSKCCAKLKVGGNLIKKLEEISSKVLECRRELENTIVISQSKYVISTFNESQLPRSYKFRQSIIQKLHLTSLESLNTTRTISEENSFQSHFPINSSPSIKQELFVDSNFAEDFSDFEIDAESTDYENEESSNALSQNRACRKRKRNISLPSYDKEHEIVEHEFSLPESNSAQIQPNSNIEFLKKRAIEQIAKVHLRRLESMSQSEIELLIKPNKLPRLSKFNKVNRHSKIIVEGQIQYEEIVENGRVKFKCLVPGCSRVITNTTAKNEHKYDHYAEDIQCPLCPSTFNYPRSLKQHLKGKHKEKTNNRYIATCREYRKKMKKISYNISDNAINFNGDDSQSDSSCVQSTAAKREIIRYNTRIEDKRSGKVWKIRKKYSKRSTSGTSRSSKDIVKLNVIREIECVPSETNETPGDFSDSNEPPEDPQNSNDPNIPKHGFRKLRFSELEGPNGIKRYECLVPGCSRILTSVTCKQDHKYFHYKQKISCPICTKQYPIPRSLRFHLRTVHKQTTNDLFLTQLREFRKKMRNAPIYLPQPGEMKSKQKKKESVNPQEFKKIFKLKNKQRERIVCDICGKSYFKHYLVEHLKAHSNVEELICPICNKTFSTLKAKKAHIRNMHEMTREEREKLAKAKVTEICQICGVLVRGGLKRHMIAHSELRPFKCTIPDCGMTFKRKTDLNNHEFKHTGQRPYICPKCGKTFSSSSVYRVHVRTHSEVMSHHCGICNQSFKMWEYLYVHLRRHREKDEKAGISNSPAIQLLKDISRVNSKSRPKRINKGLNLFDEVGNLLESSSADLANLGPLPILNSQQEFEIERKTQRKRSKNAMINL